VRPRVLVTAPRAIQSIAWYEAELTAGGCDVVSRPVVERLAEPELLPLVGDVDAMICGDDRITERVLDAAPRLRVIAKWGTGMDSIDVAAAIRRGIVVRNSPGAFSEPVADTVLGYVLLFARQPDRMAEDMRAGSWQRRPLRALNECTLGIVGFGASGRAVARRANACGMRVLANSLEPLPADEQHRLNVTTADVDTLLAESDFVSLNADLRPESRHIINAARLRRMKAGAVLINTARGQLVDETALISALREGHLAGAALDVFEQEPLPAESPLRTLPNVYLAPHNANASHAAADRVHAATIRHVLEVLAVKAAG
jgi:D-3-phosphoglycerate dehydrogenase / 2-oxoglutarate reductase